MSLTNSATLLLPPLVYDALEGLGVLVLVGIVSGWVLYLGMLIERTHEKDLDKTQHK